MTRPFLCSQAAKRFSEIKGNRHQRSEGTAGKGPGGHRTASLEHRQRQRRIQCHTDRQVGGIREAETWS